MDIGGNKWCELLDYIQMIGNWTKDELVNAVYNEPGDWRLDHKKYTKVELDAMDRGELLVEMIVRTFE